MQTNELQVQCQQLLTDELKMSIYGGSDPTNEATMPRLDFTDEAWMKVKRVLARNDVISLRFRSRDMEINSWINGDQTDECESNQGGRAGSPLYQFNASEGEGASKYKIALLSTRRNAANPQLRSGPGPGMIINATYRFRALC